MWIKNVELENIGKHRHLNLDLPKGLIGIFGPNGCGKSTVVDAIYAALTNDWGRFAGVKLDNICDLAEEGENSMIHVVVEHEGTEFTVVRSLRPNRSELHIPGRKVMTKSPEIQEELEKRLGISATMMDSHVFIGQWHMFAFMSGTASERAKAYQRLCRTEKAAVIYKAAGDMLDGESVSTEIIDNSDELRATIGENEKAKAKATTKKESIEGKLLDHDKKMKARRFLARFERVKQINAELKNVCEDEDRQREESDKATVALESLTTSEESLEERAADATPKAKRAKQALSQFAKFTANRASRTSLTASIEVAEEALEELVKPKKPKGVSKEDEWQKERGLTESQVEQYSSALQQFDDDGEVECPTCGTLVSDMDDHLTHMRGTLPTLKERVTELTSMLKAIGKWRVERRRWKDDQARLERQLETGRGKLADLDELDEPEGDEYELRETVSAAAKLVSELETKKASRQKQEVECGRLSGALMSVRGQITDLEDERKEKDIKQSSAEKAQKALDRHQERETAIAVIDETVRNLTQSIEEDEESLERIESQLGKHEKKIMFVNKLKRFRRIMHHKSLPAAVAQRNIESMEDDINKVLKRFGDSFWVEASDDLSFVVHFSGEPPRPAARLSGGQKGILALGFRSTVSSIFGAEIGMMALDEPTAGMDSQNREAMGEVLVRFAAEVRDRRQVIMITHADELRSSFDHVIDLGFEE